MYKLRLTGCDTESVNSMSAAEETISTDLHQARASDTHTRRQHQGVLCRNHLIPRLLPLLEQHQHSLGIRQRSRHRVLEHSSRLHHSRVRDNTRRVFLTPQLGIDSMAADRELVEVAHRHGHSYPAIRSIRIHLCRRHHCAVRVARLRRRGGEEPRPALSPLAPFEDALRLTRGKAGERQEERRRWHERAQDDLLRVIRDDPEADEEETVFRIAGHREGDVGWGFGARIGSGIGLDYHAGDGDVICDRRIVECADAVGFGERDRVGGWGTLEIDDDGVGDVDGAPVFFVVS